MKKILLLLILVIISCSRDNENNSNEKYISKIIYGTGENFSFSYENKKLKKIQAVSGNRFSEYRCWLPAGGCNDQFLQDW